VTGILFLIIFSYGLGWLPAFGMRSPLANPDGYLDTYLSVDFLRHYILPFTATVLFYSGDFLMLARNSVVERKGSEFLMLHRAKGLSDMEQLGRAGRNSLLPLVTYFALRTGMLFQGVITLEVVFAWPGIGRALVQAILNQDYPTVQAAVFIMALAVIIMNLTADIAYARLDPTNTELIASVAQRRRETGGRNERVSSNASSILSNAYHDTCQLARAWLKRAL